MTFDWLIDSFIHSFIDRFIESNIFIHFGIWSKQKSLERENFRFSAKVIVKYFEDFSDLILSVLGR